MLGLPVVYRECSPFSNWCYGTFIFDCVRALCLFLCHQSNSMRVVTALEIPTEEAISGYSGSALPNQQYASDHICLCFDMVLGQPQNNIPDASTAPTAASGACSRLASFVT